MARKGATDPGVFLLPDLGEGLAEAELIKWRVEVGQEVGELDVLAEMETDKALVEVTSPRAGKIAALHGEPGQVLKVGSPFVTYEGGGAAAAAPKAKAKAPAGATDNGNDKASGEREDDGTVVGTMEGRLAGIAAEPGKALATPAVRRLARDLGVEIDSVHGSGIGGRVTERDVRAAASGGSRGGGATTTAARSGRPAPARDTFPAPGPAPSPGRDTFPDAGGRSGAPAGEDERIPFRGVRRTIATRLRESVDRAVHFTVMDEVDGGPVDAMRRRLAAASGERVSVLPFVASALCRVLRMEEFRSLNSTVEEPEDGEGTIVRHRAVHLGIATDTDSGLMVPVIRDCDALGVLQIAREISAAASAARDRSIPRDRLLGSTFTISNVGSHAGRFATPIINYPEVGILAVGRGREGIAVRGGGMFPTLLLPLSLACDHRVVDGATAARALAHVLELLAEPDALLAPARQ